MKIIFGTSDKLVSRIIRWKTWGEWSHCGVLIGDTVIEARGIPVREYLKHRFLGVPYSTEHGVMETPLSEFVEKYPRHTVRYIHGDASKAYELIGKPFDMSAIFGSLFHKDWHSPDEYMCAEVVAHCLPTVEKQHEQKVNPSMLYCFSRALNNSEM
jgi:hypothetical protein